MRPGFGRGVLRAGRLVAEGTPAGLVQASGEANLARAFLSLLRAGEAVG